MPSPPILVIAPHALDEVLGSAGTMALAAECGRPVHVLVMFGDGEGHDVKRRTAARDAAAVLGITDVAFGGLPENRGDTIPLMDAVGIVERAVSTLRPDTVYVAHGGNLHIDHQIAFRAAATALRPAPSQAVRYFYGYEVPSSTDWSPPGLGMPFLPTRFVDISTVLALKRKALEAYAFELRPPPHARALEAVLNLARMRGASVGLEAAEAFSVLREIETGGLST
jgi:LmbE family N-acetylglucosaminyl deacetylase